MTILEHLNRLPFEVKERLLAERERQLRAERVGEDFGIATTLEGDPAEEDIDDLYDAIRATIDVGVADKERGDHYWSALGTNDYPLLEIDKYYSSVDGRVFLIATRIPGAHFYSSVVGQCVATGARISCSTFGESDLYQLLDDPGSVLILRPVEWPPEPPRAWVKPGPERRALQLD